MKLFFLKAASFLIGHIPMPIALYLGRALGRLAYALAARQRKTIMENLDIAFGASMTAERKEEISRKVFTRLAVMLFEFARIPWLDERKLRQTVECEGIENFDAALRDGTGIILLTAHFGNWEMLGAYLGLKGYTLDVVARDIDSPVLDEFVRWVRSRCGNRIVSKGRAMRRLVRILGGNGIAGILIDQNVALAEGVFVDFFGTLACTNKGPAHLAALTGAAVVPTFIVSEGGRHKVIIKKKLSLGLTGDRDADARENTARFTRAVELMVRERPEQWFWVHRRWKTRPPAGGRE